MNGRKTLLVFRSSFIIHRSSFPAMASGTAPVEFLAQSLQGLAGVVGNVGVLGVGEAVEVGPQQRQALQGNKLDRLVDALRVLAGKCLSEPVQGLPFTQPRQGGAG